MKNNKFITFLKEGIYSIFYIMVKEFKNVFHDAGVIIFLLIVPIIYPPLYAYIYDPEIARDVKVVAVDNSKSTKSREFLRKLDATSEVKITAYANDMEEAQKLLKRKKAYGIVHIPDDFYSDIVKGDQAFIQLYTDMSSLLYYKSILLAATEVSLDMGKEIRMDNFSGMSIRDQEISATPVEYEEIAMFNPRTGFASFLIPMVLIMVIQQTLILGIGMLAGTARDKNMFKDLIPVDEKYNRAIGVVLGKSLCYLSIYIILTFYLLKIIPAIFKLPSVGNFAEVSIFILPYLLACVFFAMFLSTIVRGRESPYLLFIFTSVPFIFIAGVSWPMSSVPAFWKIFGWFIPSTHGIQGFVKMNTMGAALNDVAFEYRSLWVLTGVYFMCTYFLYTYHMDKHRKNILAHHRMIRAERSKKRLTKTDHK